MKRHKPLIIATLLCLAALQAAAQAVVTVVPRNGDTQEIVLSADGQIYFTSDHMVIADGNANNSFAMADVQKVLFSAPVKITRVDNIPELTLAPNPAADRVTVSGIGQGAHPLWVYSLSGATAMQTTCTDGQPVDISQLPRGIYLLRVGPAVAKLIKY